MEFDNPAARLYNFLSELQLKGDQVSLRQALCEVFGTAHTTEFDPKALSNIVTMANLADESFTLIQRHFPNKVKLTEYWRGRLSAAISNVNLNGNVLGFTQSIDERAMEALSLTSIVLDGKYSPKLLEGDQLIAWREQLQGLLDEVAGSNCASRIKVHLAKCLRRIIDAINEYWITGSEAVLEAIDLAMGRMATDKDYRDFMLSQEGKPILSVLGAIGDVVTIALALPPLIEMSQAVIEMGKAMM